MVHFVSVCVCVCAHTHMHAYTSFVFRDFGGVQNTYANLLGFSVVTTILVWKFVLQNKIKAP